MQEQIIKEALEILSNHFQIDTTFETSDSNLREEVGLDSLDVLDLCQRVESHFNVSGLEDEIEKLNTIRDIAISVEAKLGHK